MRARFGYPTAPVSERYVRSARPPEAHRIHRRWGRLEPETFPEGVNVTSTARVSLPTACPPTTFTTFANVSSTLTTRHGPRDKAFPPRQEPCARPRATSRAPRDCRWEAPALPP